MLSYSLLFSFLIVLIDGQVVSETSTDTTTATDTTASTETTTVVTPPPSNKIGVCSFECKSFQPMSYNYLELDVPGDTVMVQDLPRLVKEYPLLSSFSNVPVFNVITDIMKGFSTGFGLFTGWWGAKTYYVSKQAMEVCRNNICCAYANPKILLSQTSTVPVNGTICMTKCPIFTSNTACK